MPKYSMRKKPKATQEQRMQTKPMRGSRKYTKRLPKDPNKLLRWAGSGTVEDYDRLHKLARRARATVPTYLEEAVERISTIDRLGLIEEIQATTLVPVWFWTGSITFWTWSRSARGCGP